MITSYRHMDKLTPNEITPESADYIRSRRHFYYHYFLFLFSKENKIWYIMRIICWADVSHGSQVLFSLKNNKRIN